MIRFTAVVWFVSSLFILSIPSTSHACSCAEVPTVEEELERSDAVFMGKVLKVKEKRHLDGRMTKIVLFEVERTWKGISESQVIITTGSGGGDCGYDFTPGKEYLVYARHSSMYGNENDLVTIICDRTTEAVNAEEDLAVLGEGEAPAKKVNLEGRFAGPDLYFWGTALLFLGLVVFLLRRRLKR